MTLHRSTPIAHESFRLAADLDTIAGFSIGVLPEAEAVVVELGLLAPGEINRSNVSALLSSKSYALKMARGLLEAAEYLPEGS